MYQPFLATLILDRNSFAVLNPFPIILRRRRLCLKTKSPILCTKIKGGFSLWIFGLLRKTLQKKRHGTPCTRFFLPLKSWCGGIKSSWLEEASGSLQLFIFFTICFVRREMALRFRGLMSDAFKI